MELQKKIIRFLEGPQPRFILWSPLWLMLGIGLYFGLYSEPPVWIGYSGLGIAAVLLAVSWRYPLRWLVLPVFLIASGFTASQWRAGEVATPLLSYPANFRVIEATIEEIEPVDSNAKLVLSHVNVERLPEKYTPLRIRVRFRGNDPSWQIGDRIRFMGSLFPLPLPAMPGSYDFARHFYFRQIGATGYAVKPPEIIGRRQDNGWHGWINTMRHTIGENMRAAMPGPVGTVAAAMTVGETGPIPADTKTDLRDAGLAHMLAIAGLHLGIVTGIVFFTLRLLFSLYQPFALRWPIKKIAAIFALASAFIYLMLAGYPIPAQRAFIMVSFLFVAVLSDRRGITLRSLAIAADIILLLLPEAMFGASFQLSFAATMAIIALFDSIRSLFHRQTGWLRSIMHEVFAIGATSLAATLATAPFVLYHFNRFALFGLIANMIVIPLATFVIMPGMVLALLLMPLGLQAIGYIPLHYGTEWMLHMAHWVTSLPYASIHLPSLTPPGLALAAFGLGWLCLWQSRLRFLGLAPIAVGLASITLYQPYDLLVNDDATKVALRLDSGEFLFIRGRPSSFNAQVWTRADGSDEDNGLSLRDMRGSDDAPDCNETRCLVTFKGKKIAVALHTGSSEGLCNDHPDIAITSDAVAKKECGAHWLVDKESLAASGPVAFRFSADSVHMSTASELRGDRPWVSRSYSSLYQFHNKAINYHHEDQ